LHDDVAESFAAACIDYGTSDFATLCAEQDAGKQGEEKLHDVIVPLAVQKSCARAGNQRCQDEK
jgi:hypothetical protein